MNMSSCLHAFSLRFCIVQVIKNERQGRPGNETSQNRVCTLSLEKLGSVDIGVNCILGYQQHWYAKLCMLGYF